MQIAVSCCILGGQTRTRLYSEWLGQGSVVEQRDQGLQLLSFLKQASWVDRVTKRAFGALTVIISEY